MSGRDECAMANPTTSTQHGHRENEASHCTSTHTYIPGTSERMGMARPIRSKGCLSALPLRYSIYSVHVDFALAATRGRCSHRTRWCLVPSVLPPTSSSQIPGDYLQIERAVWSINEYRLPHSWWWLPIAGSLSIAPGDGWRESMLSRLAEMGGMRTGESTNNQLAGRVFGMDNPRPRPWTASRIGLLISLSRDR